MNKVVLKYHWLFAVSVLLTVLFIFGGWYQMVVNPPHFWHVARLPPWVVITALVISTTHCFLTMIIASYEIGIDENGFATKRLLD